MISPGFSSGQEFPPCGESRERLSIFNIPDTSSHRGSMAGGERKIFEGMFDDGSVAWLR